jgi:hypothetical protein
VTFYGQVINMRSCIKNMHTTVRMTNDAAILRMSMIPEPEFSRILTIWRDVPKITAIEGYFSRVKRSINSVTFSV